MIAEKQKQSANYMRILSVLQALRTGGMITEPEFEKAKEYYREITGADIIILSKQH